ncbi:MAG: S-layer homology domain-containing protein, partial [Oscillospiraceae bacterium]
KADVIVGSVALDSGSYGPEAEKAVRSGVPYIACGTKPLDFVRANLLAGNQVDTGKKDEDGEAIYSYNYFNYDSLGMESLHKVTYPANSIATASYVADGDDVLYSYNCGVITQIPAGAKTLIRAADTDSHIAGCCLTADGKAMDGKVEAIAFTKDGMDLTLFANSTANRAHQQDDYRYVTNTIYSKTLSKTPMTISGTASVPVFTDVPANHWAVDDIYATAEQKFLSGTSATTFAPSAEMSRAMLITALHRMSGKAAAVAPGATWYDAAMVWGKDAGVTDGSNPQGNVTREQIAVLLYNYAKTQGSVTPLTDKELAGFKDTASVSKWAADGMAWAVGNHIIGGKSGEKLDPGSFATRAEVAAMVSRFAKI